MTEQKPYVHVEQVKKNVFRVNLREWYEWGGGGYWTTVSSIAHSERQANRVGKRMLGRAEKRAALELKSWEIR